MSGEDFALSQKIERVGSKVDNMAQGLVLMNETLAVLSQMTARILEACTDDREPSTLGEAMKELAAAGTQQAVAIETLALAIRDNTDRIEMQPEAFKHAVVEALDEREGKGA